MSIAPERTDLAVARILAGGFSVARIRIDSGATACGTHWAPFAACSFVPFVGEPATAVDRAGVEHPARVIGIDEALRLVHLEMGAAR